MKKVLLFAALAFAAVACNEEAAPVEETNNDTSVVIPSEDEIPGPGHVDAEEGGMVEGPGASDAAK
jgi:hypothetical protein